MVVVTPVDLAVLMIPQGVERNHTSECEPVLERFALWKSVSDVVEVLRQVCLVELVLERC